MIRRLFAFLLFATPAVAATPRDALVIAMNIDSVITLDNAQIGEIASDLIFTNACLSLVQSDPHDPAKIIPGTADSWTVSPDQLTYTFKLHPGLTYASGNPVTAEDLAWSMKRFLTLNFGNAAQFTAWGFTAATADEDFQALDATTLRIKVRQPFPINLFLQALTGRSSAANDRVEVMKHAVGSDLGNGWLKTHLNCFGPWTLRSWNAGESLTLERRDDYPLGKAALRRVIIRNVTESGSERLLLERGDIDIAPGLNTEDQKSFADSTTTRPARRVRGETTYIGFNVSDPILGRAKVREAFRYMIDYDALQKTVFAQSGIARATPVPTWAFGALQGAEAQPFRLDLDRARALLAEAGVTEGFSREIISYAYSPYLEVSQHLQANAAKLGITLSITPLVSSQLLGRNRARQFDIVVLNWADGAPDSDAMLTRHATNPDNRQEAGLTMYPAWRMSFSDPWFNEAVPKARMEPDVEKRRAMYHEIATRFLHEGPNAYLFQGVFTYRVSNVVKDIVITDTHFQFATAVK